jgi:hypothetical protein
VPSAEDDRQFGNVLLASVLDAEYDVRAVGNSDLERTFEKSLHDFEDAVVADSRGKTNSQQYGQYQDEMAAVKALLRRYGIESSCGLDFTGADFTTGPTAT